MSNIKSFGDFSDDPRDNPYRFVGGQKSGIGVEEDAHKVHLFEGGFTVDEGPFRPLDNPENALFLSCVRSGVAPPELQDQGKEVKVFFIDESHRKYEKPQSDVRSSCCSTKAHDSRKVEDVCLDSGPGKLTTLRIKISNDRQLNVTISQSRTIGELRSFIAQRSGLSESSFRMLSGFPPREVKGGDAETLENADLLGCTVLQKPTE